MSPITVDEATALQPDSMRNKHGHNNMFAVPSSRALWILVVSLVMCGSAFLLLGTSSGVLRSTAAAVEEDSREVLTVSPEMEVAQGAFFWGIDQKKFDLPEEQCAEFFAEYFDENVVVDYSGGPCEFLTGIHEGIPELCSFYKNMDGHSQVTEAPEVVFFQTGDIVLAKVHGPYETIPEGKIGVVDEMAALTMRNGKIARIELFVSHAKDFVC